MKIKREENVKFSVFQKYQQQLFRFLLMWSFNFEGKEMTIAIIKWDEIKLGRRKREKQTEKKTLKKWQDSQRR